MFQVTGLRQDSARVEHDGLGNDRRDAGRVGSDVLINGRSIVPGQHHRIFRCMGGLSCRLKMVRPWYRVAGGDRWVLVDQDVVEPPVIVAFELDDLGTSGMSARYAERRLDHL